MLSREIILLIHPGVMNPSTAHQDLPEEGARLETDHPEICPEEVDSLEGAVRRVEAHLNADHLDVLQGVVHQGEDHQGEVPRGRRTVPK